MLKNQTHRFFNVGFFAAPFLYLLFWPVDIFLYPEHKWNFLVLRMSHLVFVLGLSIYFRKLRKIKSYRLLGLCWAFIAGGLISTMVFQTNGPDSPYYAGLNLVALLAIFFVPYQIGFQLLTVASIYIPYFLVCLTFGSEKLGTLFVNACFCLGTISIGLTIRRLNDLTRRGEIEAQVALAREIADREIIITRKSEETIKLSKLSNQFSPQVVEAIRQGDLNLDIGAKRVEICSIFIDIVNSTSRVVRVDKDKIHKVISMFLEDTVGVLLKYDLTIDKFMGDGILAFSNNPVKHENFAERTVRAGIEIRDLIKRNEEKYENYWMNKFEIRIGVSLGFANVGFYGNDKLYKCYTAIGPVVNLAARLCSSALPNEMVISKDVMDKLPPSLFACTFLGKKTLKGFEEDLIKCYAVQGYLIGDSAQSTEAIDCPQCSSGALYLDSNDLGQFIFKCRHCGYVAGDIKSGSDRVA